MKQVEINKKDKHGSKESRKLKFSPQIKEC